MVSVVTALLFASLGLLAYIAIPIVAGSGPIHIRERVGTFYLKGASKVLKQFTFVRRVLSGYDILPISVDDEQKLLEVTLSSSIAGSNNTYRFADPDNRIGRVFNKPIALAYEHVPAALDAELAEWGHWVGEKADTEGMVKDKGEGTKIDPYVVTSDNLRLVDPIDAFNLVTNDVSAENIKTAEQKTKKRFEKYKPTLGLRQTARVMFGFAVGAGGVVGVQYMNSEVMGNSGDPSAPIVGNQTLQAFDPALAMDVMGAML